MLIDIRMPGVSGEQLSAFVRSQSSLRLVRLVGYTAHCFSDKIARFKAAGFDEVLIKPVLMADMLRLRPWSATCVGLRAV
jgi:CheY-like chemotaxis protein